MFHPPTSDRCLALAHPDYINFVFSILILLGILLSYLPQHHRIISRKSSFGLSPYFVLLGTTSGTCQFANILTLPGSRADMACCRDDGVSGLFLFLIYFPRATPGTTNPAKDADKQPSFKTAVIVAWICIAHAFVTAIISIYFTLAHPAGLQSWANFLGILSTVLAVIQYFPQIWTTYLLKRVASLSIPMMCIQTPGSFVWAASLASRLGVEGWSAWGVYVVTGCLQGTLLVMGVIYELRWRRKEREELEGRIDAANQGQMDGQVDTDRRVEDVSEQTPLIRQEE
ncbi:hypothetical protein OHC33_003312 [Knufia fluminis]|uniref:PQ loop repeat protein n=1 Tax=Knufia fluminis TaxID=191047 RepID=A0AAN8I9J8_9EURO|nr:hypothetical protein OHC33_003312 [Knufia fluminis]